MSKLKPCPFCDEQAMLINHANSNKYYAECSSCEATVESSADKIVAIEAWNQRASGWISVTDRLPSNTGITVLIACGYVTTARVNRIGEFCTPSGSGVRYKPTHWQPLPKAP